MNDHTFILNELLDNIRTDVINSMQSKGRHATGETVQNLTIAVTPELGILYAPRWIDALEVGRKPTSEGAVTSDPTLFDRIVVWLQAKGIVANPYAVTKSIHKRGYKGTPGVLTEPLSDDNVGKRVDVAAQQLSEIYGKQVAELFDIFGE